MTDRSPDGIPTRWFRGNCDRCGQPKAAARSELFADLDDGHRAVCKVPERPMEPPKRKPLGRRRRTE